DLRKKWREADKSMRLEKIRNVEFAVLSLSSNDVPKTWRKFFPPAPEVHEIGEKETPPKPETKDDIFIGQVDSLLILGNSAPVVEKVVAHLTGGAAPALGELASYDANHQALFRDSPAYGWANVKLFFDLLNKSLSEKKESAAPEPLP